MSTLVTRKGVRHEVVTTQGKYVHTLCGGRYYVSQIGNYPYLLDCYRCKNQQRAAFTPLSFSDLERGA